MSSAEAMERTFDRIDTLVLKNLAMTRLSISVGSGSGGSIAITPGSAVGDEVEIEASGGRVTVRGSGGTSSTVIGHVSSSAVGSGAHSSVSIGGHSVSSSGGRKVAVDATVPAGTTLTISGTLENGRIGAVGGDLTLMLAEGDLTIGRVQALSLNLTGRNRVTVESVDGDATLETTGQPTVRIAGGSIGSLGIRMTGEGSIEIDAGVRDASVEIIGEARVRIAEVKGQLRQSVVGPGGVRVGR